MNEPAHVANAVEASAWEALRLVLDPELGLNIVDLGLVYALEADASGHLDVKLTMTSAACPLGEQVRESAQESLLQLPGVESVAVALVWDSPWSPERMSPYAKAVLGWGA